MNRNPCEQLEDYLDDALAGDEAAVFELHLTNCAECGNAVSQNAAIAGWLIAACAKAEPVPTALADRVESRIRGARTRRRVATLATSCAAIVLGGLILWWVRDGNRPDEPKPITETRFSLQPDAPSDPAQLPTVADDRSPHDNDRNLDPEDAPGDIVAVAGDVITVHIPTGRPDVTIYWVYPTLKTANR